MTPGEIRRGARRPPRARRRRLARGCRAGRGHRRHRDVALHRRAAIGTRGGSSRAPSADRFVAWLRGGPADVGNTVRRGLRRVHARRHASGPPSEGDAGNGAAMRMVPVALATLADRGARSRPCAARAGAPHAPPPALRRRIRPRGRARPPRVPRALPEPAAPRAPPTRSRPRLPAFAFEPYRGLATGYVADTLQTVLHSFHSHARLRGVPGRGGEPGRRRRHDRRDRRAPSPARTTARSSSRARWLRRLDRARPGRDRGAADAARGALAAGSRRARLADHPAHAQLAAEDEQLALALQDSSEGGGAPRRRSAGSPRAPPARRLRTPTRARGRR